MADRLLLVDVCRPACQLRIVSHNTSDVMQEGTVAAQVQAHAQEGTGKLTLRMSTGRWCEIHTQA